MNAKWEAVESICVEDNKFFRLLDVREKRSVAEE